MGDQAQKAYSRIGSIYGEYLNDLEQAVEAYAVLLKRYPGSKEATEAQFQVAEHYMEQKDYPQAELMVTRYLQNFPSDKRAGDAGCCWRNVRGGSVAGSKHWITIRHT